jgi:hypothetical protein
MAASLYSTMYTHPGAGQPCKACRTPWHGIGTEGQPPQSRFAGPHLQAAQYGEEVFPENGFPTNVFSEQLLDGYSKEKGRCANLYLAPMTRCFGLPTQHRFIHVGNKPTVFACCRNIYDRANDCFRKDEVETTSYLMEFVTPLPEDAWWCPLSDYNAYMTFAARIFISRLKALMTSDGVVIGRPKVNETDFGWRRDIIHEYHGARIATQTAIRLENLDSTAADRLFAAARKRAMKGIVIQSAVMAALVSLLNAKRRMTPQAYSKQVLTLISDADTNGEQETFKYWLEHTVADEARAEEDRLDYDRRGSAFDQLQENDY